MIQSETKEGFTLATDEAYLSFTKGKNGIVQISFVDTYNGLCDDWIFASDLQPFIDALQRFKNELNK